MMLPEALAPLGAYRQFIVCLLVPLPNGKTDKIPCCSKTGARGINSQDSQFWVSADEAYRVAATREDYRAAFVITDADPIFCLDIDGALLPDGNWSPLVNEALAAVPSVGCEVSQSGAGLHCWGTYVGAMPPHRCKPPADIRATLQGDLELYHAGRFICLGQPGATGAIGDCTTALPAVIARWFPPSTAPESASPSKGRNPAWRGPEDDDELIQRMLNSRQSVEAAFGGKASLRDLWEGNTDAMARQWPKDGGYDASSADMALAVHLAFWTGCDAERMERLMHRSGLRRDKYDRGDYLPLRTIPNAIRITTKCYDESQPAGEKASRTAPEPLPSLPDVMPFDYSYLPDSLRGYVQDISERMQCPPDFAAVTAYVMMATIIGRKVGIRPMRHNDWTVIANLWGAVVGNSGVMKSPTTSAVLSPLKQLQAWAFQAFNDAMADHAAQEELAKLQKSVTKSQAKKQLSKDKTADVTALLKSDAGGDAPILKRFMTNNASYEALGEILMENPNGLLVESDEIIGLLKQLDAGGQEVARSFYLTAADGDKPYTFDRIMRGKGLHIPALCLSIIGGVQPGVLAEYVRQATGGGAGADGLLQRFGLMVYPDISPDWKEVDRYPNSAAREAVDALVQRLDNLAPLVIGAEEDKFGGVPFLRFDGAAQALFSEWRHALEVRLRSGEEHPAIVSHLSKFRKLIPSLALINHLCDGQHGAVNEAALTRAIAFSEYLESHARRIYSYATRPDIDAAKTLLKKLTTGKLPTPFKTRDIYRAGWTGLETPAKAQAAISLLHEYGHLDVEELSTGGRATTLHHWAGGVAA
jgi:putative DNA primase/helicase